MMWEKTFKLMLNIVWSEKLMGKLRDQCAQQLVFLKSSVLDFDEEKKSNEKL